MARACVFVLQKRKAKRGRHRATALHCLVCRLLHVSLTLHAPRRIRSRAGRDTDPGGGGGGGFGARGAHRGQAHMPGVDQAPIARPPPGRATDIELAGLASPLSLSLSLAGGPRPPHHARGHTSIRSRPAGPARNVPALQAIDHGPVQFLPPITIFLNYEMQQQLVHLHCSSNL